ncbi:hypothetical protein CMQ_1686 [Grosmannia clavigera kw1407]|uniref:Uncharacterized protein n=1 Tax=Grosmannia clavigera (strain kw1407 / UAMH 11150) TaxID=655863 RepID=F0XE48_GROCL|nr:uncharacterized protein CMQ_1686 [Grosmannia clavigera kw1407]EFX04758.1 hypothetical protein CMQ_1686 [Grosmannia clavigera kw1407]
MPSRKSGAATQKQHDIDNTVTSIDVDLSSDIDEGFNPVQAATDLKKVVEIHKKRRHAMRKKIEARYEARVTDIVRRTERRLAERDERIAEVRGEQLARLVAAVEGKDTQQRSAAGKVARFYDGCINLANVIESVYTGLAAEAKAADLVASVSGE